MPIIKLLSIIFFFLLQSGCSEFYSYQPPAPVYGGQVVYNPYEVNMSRSQPEPIKPAPADIVKLPSPAGNHSTARILPEKPGQRSKTPVLSPAVVALMSESERNRRSGHLESAVVALERALRIDPRNPVLTYKLAVLRIKQNQPILAEDLAKKAALLAAENKSLKRKSWLLISQSRQMQGNYHAAKEAKLKADSFLEPERLQPYFQ